MIDSQEVFQYEYSDNKWKLAVGKMNYGRLKGHSLHYIGPYGGSFPPELVHYFLFKYSNPNDIIFDPFSGRGTTGLQAVLNNRQTIVNDLNPLAYIYSFAKLFPMSSKEVNRFLDKVPPISTNHYENLSEERRHELLAYFHKDTLKELLNLNQFLLTEGSVQSKYIQALIAGTLRGNRISNLSITMSALICFSANYMRKWSEKNQTFPDYREVNSRLVKKGERLERDGLKFRRDSRVLQEDATNLVSIENNSIDTIITSPPYFNVINYAYDNRLRLWSLGHYYKDIQKTLCHTSSISKYSEFIQKSINEMYRVLKDDSWAVIVVGDVKRKNGKKAIIVNTAEIIASTAIKQGFQVEMIINDALPEEKGTCGRATSLTNRFNVKIDRCVVLRKGKPDYPDHKINWNKLVNPKIY
ncbi:MAG: DNA methyltransferase [Candidatus Hodarchaeales archaeon]|jgi:DNA modification methylase